MRSLLLLLTVVSTPAWAQVEKPTLIDSDTPFTPNGEVRMDESGFRTKEINKVEVGVLNGVHYRFYYTDGSGTFAGKEGNTGGVRDQLWTNWDVACEKDPINDKKHCYMSIKDLYIVVYPKGSARVSIGSNHFPGSVVTIRIDKGTPMSAPAKNGGRFDGKASAALIKQLRNARSVTTRFMEWPEKSWDDETWELYGFNETYQYITWAVERIK